MSPNRSGRVGSWLLVVLLCALAIGAWGYYAWRFATPRGVAAGGSGMAGQNGSAEPGSPEPISTLQATRAASESRPQVDSPAAQPASYDRPTGEDSSTTHGGSRPSLAVAANQPPSPDQGVEIDLGGGVSSPAAAELLETARQTAAKGDLVAAREAFSTALQKGLNPVDAAFARSEAWRIAEALLFSRTTTPDDPLAGTYIVASGETLNGIARKNKVTEDLLISINKLRDPNRLMAGAKLKIIHGPFDVYIDKTAHRLDVLLGGVLVRSMRVGLGTNGGTPTGTWVVQDKLKNPEWTDPQTGRHFLADDPENPIGERWIGLNGIEGECVGRVGFGIHGTIAPTSIGENMSMGCVRLLPDDVAFVADLLVVGDSRVVIR